MAESGISGAPQLDPPIGKVRWGILGTGDIARQFASDLNLLEEAELLAVGSRAEATARRFGDAHSIPRRYGAYEDLASDPDIDLVYIGTPHPYHHANTLMCLEQGRGVVCEKPFAMNFAEAQEMVKSARRRKLFLMEAMWTYCFPAIQEINSLIRSGAIGEVRMLKADFCFRIDFDPEFRLFNRELGGGALLDVGIYPVALSHLVFEQPPKSVSASAHLGQTGVDEQAGMVLSYPEGQLAVLTCASRTELPQEALIVGSEGWVRVPRFSQPDAYTIGNPRSEETKRFERVGYGYAFEAREAMSAFKAGKTECEIVPLESTLSVLETLDRIRSQWGLRYPNELGKGNQEIE